MENKQLWEKHWIPDDKGRALLAYTYNFEFRKFIQPFIHELGVKGVNWKALDENLHDAYLNEWKIKYDAFDGNYDNQPQEYQWIYKEFDRIVEKKLKDNNVD